jgi:hypothetical protein
VVPHTNRPMKIHCHCEEQSDEAIQMDRHGALRAPRDDNSVKGKGYWYQPATGSRVTWSSFSRRMPPGVGHAISSPTR